MAAAFEDTRLNATRPVRHFVGGEVGQHHHNPRRLLRTRPGDQVVARAQPAEFLPEKLACFASSGIHTNHWPRPLAIFPVISLQSQKMARLPFRRHQSARTFQKGLRIALPFEKIQSRSMRNVRVSLLRRFVAELDFCRQHIFPGRYVAEVDALDIDVDLDADMLTGIGGIARNRGLPRAVYAGAGGHWGRKSQPIARCKADRRVAGKRVSTTRALRTSREPHLTLP